MAENRGDIWTQRAILYKNRQDFDRVKIGPLGVTYRKENLPLTDISYILTPTVKHEDAYNIALIKLKKPVQKNVNNVNLVCFIVNNY